MNEPINVTPGGPPSEDEFHRRYYAERDQGPEWKSWDWAAKGRGFPWLGVLLVLIGVALLIQYFVPAISVTTLVLLAVALAFLAAWVLGGSSLAMVPGLLVLGIGLAELLEDMAVFGPAGQDVPGLWSAAIALAFVAIWGLGWANKRQSSWPLWAAAIFGLIAAVQMSGRIFALPALGALWPVLIIGIGIFLLLGARQRAR